MAEHIVLESVVPFEQGGSRLDQIAAHCFPDFSRAKLQAWIKQGELTVDNEVRKPKDKLYGGELLRLNAQVENDETHQPEEISLNIVYEDDDIVVLNKPEGLVVHPAAGHHSGTLLNALLHHCPDLASVPRAGIVHRLDKDTTGIMVVAKSLAAHTSLVAQLQDRVISREYEAIACGVMTAGGTVDQPVGRHPTQRTKMAVIESGKEAVTHYRVLHRFRAHTHVRVKLETGRTHQIRVHMSHIHYPLVGDQVYGGRLKLPKGASSEFIDTLQQFKRQALHARQLGLYHPATDEYMEWEIPLPDDFEQLLQMLSDDQHQCYE
ncbi:23S rRNA pseudouridine(1911/1915/1917) synthase RluD [Spartinivicinus poritis]|uniref:Pseudouridine synthase n=1 Tax=Spartinivicinus poritis TaxID=2994640 RepID=A0ABT5U2D2_9GAMM|nr:23S rRNA pseudouridine(1911/1915/1917) synthase RluD [Spartinivicinus sp. A2-2]MDE1460526.1 23S rRNA pseudouridine(1911/1915/1917) synthase RluD [Spartinivicinus sp. A2-2]